jgi:lysophospholipid acyltransferase (LPLAT)-like uncharacterized protein
VVVDLANPILQLILRPTLLEDQWVANAFSPCWARKCCACCFFCFWHNRILSITLTFRHYPGKARKGVTVLTSASRDGEILAQLIGQFGMAAVR